jgi:hypothetical protein
MAEPLHLTKEEWDELEPVLAAADSAAHEQFMESPEAKALLGDTEMTPGYLLLQHLKKIGDQEAVKLFRATEMYHHEITRADIAAAYLQAKKAAQTTRS